MDKERLLDIIKSSSFSEEQLEELDGLVKKYPWFGLPRFLRLKVYGQLDKIPESTELNRAVIFSSDREHLYKWVNGAFDSMIETMVPGSTELEFLDSTGEEPGNEAGNETGGEEPFALLDDADEDSGNDMDEDPGNDADAKPIPEKDETEMEEPEIEEPEAVPVIDPLDDEDEENAENEDEPQETHSPEKDLPEAVLQKDTVSRNVEAAAGETSSHVAPADATENDEPGDPARSGAAIDVNSTDSRTPGPSANSSGNPATNPPVNLIERFLESEPGAIKADKQTSLEGDVSKGSVQEDDSFITDTLAKIYVKQGLHAKAIYAYERLSLKYPEKSAYFAAQIEKIKNNANV